MDGTLVQVYPRSDFAELCKVIDESSEILSENIDKLDYESLSLDELAILFKQVEESLSFLRSVSKELCIETAKKMTEKTHTVPGLGTLERMAGAGARKNWDDDSLISLIYTKAKEDRIINTETGEYESETEAALRLLRECARFGWRTGEKKTAGFEGTALYRLGIDPDEYSHRDFGPAKVRFIK
jgi:hypothetical protein